MSTVENGVFLYGERVPACLWCGGIERRVALLFVEPPLICTCPGGLSYAPGRGNYSTTSTARPDVTLS